jgi:hypothetical protein
MVSYPCFNIGKKCDCKSLHWKFSNKKDCDGELIYSIVMYRRAQCFWADCGHSPMQHVSVLQLPKVQFGAD